MAKPISKFFESLGLLLRARDDEYLGRETLVENLADTVGLACKRWWPKMQVS